MKFQVEGREEEEEEEADYENPPMTPSPVRTMRHPVLAATQVRHTHRSYHISTETTLPFTDPTRSCKHDERTTLIRCGAGVYGALPSRHDARVPPPADRTGATATVHGTTAEQGMPTTFTQKLAAPP